jgi:hypothetical protein
MPRNLQISGLLRTAGGLVLTALGTVASLYGIWFLLLAAQVFGSRTGELLWFARALVGVCSLFFGGMELLLGLVSLRLRPPAARKALAAGTGIALVVTAIQVMLGGFRDVSAVMLTGAGAVLLFLVVDIGANRRATPKRRDE